ncbi:MAG: hypothetical protein N4A44_03200 [Alphaproteobacteria bacterium]|jgi:hypothetical protein|nr:hypothetical protein [Alphaproteobacteria bacterium]
MKKIIILSLLTLVLIVINVGLVFITDKTINLFGVVETTFSGWKFIASWVVIDFTGIIFILLRDVNISIEEAFDFSNWKLGL